MWPWEHVAFGYLLYSLWRHGRGESPAGVPTLALAFGTQLPDLVDKPLSWGVGLFPAGYSVAHSVFVAVPVGAAAVLVAARRDRSAVGVAFAVGYLSHLVGDVINPLRTGDGLGVERVLWPLVRLPGYDRHYDLVGRTVHYLVRFLGELAHLRSLVPVVVYLGILASVVVLWIVDGAPGVRVLFGVVLPSGD
ncbi:MAG: metal-dependent hydrolase [Haloarculaceae archaeon]